MGRPDPERICTSIVERQNLSMRMGIRRFTRLYERLQQEVGEPLGSGRVVVHVLQLLPGPQIASRDARDGSGNFGPRLERSGAAGTSLKGHL